MRFIPLNAKNRSVDTGNRYWNKRYLRGLQVVLNVMKGAVMPGREFFLQAFGRNTAEFKAIISMPDEFIRHRLVDNWRHCNNYEDRLMPYVKEWITQYFKLTDKERKALKEIIEPNDKSIIRNEYDKNSSNNLSKLLKLHLEEEDIVAKYEKI